jgi:ParB family chromosome partitioning protein
MNTFNKRTIDLELSCIEMSLAHLRIATPLQLNKLITSIDTCGQLAPVVVVPIAASHHFTLIDGYLRIQAIKKLRQDNVWVEVWECSEVDALLFLLASHGQRNWEAFEEAQALRELQTRYHLSQEIIAKRIGRTQSWISRRLALLDALSDELVQAITKGEISVWTAYRVLAPMARAMPLHAEYLFKYFQKHPHSTREVSFFFQHYQKSATTVREKMAMQPDLFFKAQKAMQADRQAKLLKAGPEGRWRSILIHISDQMKYLEELVPQLFYERQEEKTCQQLLEPVDRIQHMLNRILTTSRSHYDDRQNDASNHYDVTPIRQECPAH